MRCAVVVWLVATFGLQVAVAQNQRTDLADQIRAHEYDLRTGGRAFLLDEAGKASFFLLGEMHGENEIPALIRVLWPALWEKGYRHVAAEVSPWAAERLEFPATRPPSNSGHGLWRQSEVDTVTAFRKGSDAVLWGCDIEEVRPAELIAELASKNPASEPLKTMAAKTRQGYQRSSAGELLGLAREASQAPELANGSKRLLGILVQTLEVESDRTRPDSRLRASLRREQVMKERFLEHYNRAGDGAKVMARFGGNHLHRGYDRRGVSTLGNFIAEFALATGKSAFNVSTFCAGGQIRLGSSPIACDDTKDDPALALLASAARYPETVFDLRVIRQTLHRIPESERSAAEAGLVYWADSYDSIICYREVTPLAARE
jgi:hypothetical protein